MQYITEILSFLAGLGVGFSIKVAIDARRSSSSGATSTRQTGNRVGGHQAGRDVSVQQNRD